MQRTAQVRRPRPPHRRAGRPRHEIPKRLPRELRVIYELMHVLATGPADVAALLERVCSEVREHFGVARAALLRYDDGARTVRTVVEQGPGLGPVGVLPLERLPLLEEALAEQQAVVGNLPGRGATVAAPLLLEGRCLGFAVADRAGGELRLGTNDLHLLTTLGLVAGVLIEKASQQRALEGAIEELQRLDQLKSDLISIASHELRAPISVVHGLAATLHLRGERLTAEQRLEVRATIYAQSAKLRDLTEQLLDLSRIDSGTLRVDPCRFRPRESIDALLPRIALDRLGSAPGSASPSPAPSRPRSEATCATSPRSRTAPASS